MRAAAAGSSGGGDEENGGGVFMRGGVRAAWGRGYRGGGGVVALPDSGGVVGRKERSRAGRRLGSAQSARARILFF